VSILSLCAKNWHWIPYEKEVVKKMWNVHKFSFGTIWILAQVGKNTAVILEICMLRICIHQERVFKCYNPIGWAQFSRMFLQDGEEILKIIVHSICHYLWIFDLFLRTFCRTLIDPLTSLMHRLVPLFYGIYRPIFLNVY